MAIQESGAEAAVPLGDRPVDPFSGEPLKIVAGDGGVIVYSVGPNRRDDGGVEVESNSLRNITVFLGTAFKRRNIKGAVPEGQERDRSAHRHRSADAASRPAPSGALAIPQSSAGP